MKITRVEPILCDGGWWPWVFAKVETDEGIVGYGECSDNRACPRGVAGCIQDMEHILLDQDPRAVEKLYWDMYRLARQSLGGIAHKAIAGIEVALWDIKAKALNVPLYELFGGPIRDKIRLYWSHCGTYRARYPDILGTPPLKTMADIANLGREVVNRGFTALKTNMVVPGEPAYIVWTTDGNIDNFIVEKVEKLISTFRQAVGDKVDICLDLNFNFKTEGNIRIARALEPYNLLWLEIDTYDPEALLQIKQATKIPICSGENLYTCRGYKPFLELHSMDVAMVDVPWNGFTESRKIAALANIHEIMIAPHNYYSHLTTLMSAHLAASVPNLRIMEIDIDSAPWRDDIITELPDIEDGYLNLPKKPGLGADLNEKEIAKHPWPK
jgi:L-alanine-DL-glutamate epimerase-like enolase superfamily enzyme